MVVTEKIMIIFIGNFREKIKMWRLCCAGDRERTDLDPGLPERE